MKQVEIDALSSKVDSGGKLTCAEAIELLDECDHAILNRQWALAISKPFGCKPCLISIQDRRSEFKGAQFPNLKEGEWAHQVIGARSLAAQLCHFLNVEYVPQYGEGSQLHTCCDALRKHETLPR